MGILIGYIVPVILIVVVALLAKRAKQAPTFGNYSLLFIFALVCGAYAKLAEVMGAPIGGDNTIGAAIAIVIVLTGVGFTIWSLGKIIQKAVKV